MEVDYSVRVSTSEDGGMVLGGKFKVKSGDREGVSSEIKDFGVTNTTHKEIDNVNHSFSCIGFRRSGRHQ